MTRTHLIILTAVAALAGGVLLNRSFADPAPSTRPAAQATSVAVCNMVEILSQCKQSEQLDREFRASRAKLKTQAEEDEKKLRELEDQLRVVKVGTPDYERRLMEIGDKEIAFRITHESMQARIANGYYMAMQSIYNEVNRVVGDLAKERGIDIVLYHHHRPLTGRDPAELRERMDSREVIYADKRLDITGEVFKRVNDAYDAPKKTD